MVFENAEQILSAVLQQDTRKRLESGSELINFLLDDSQIIDFSPSLFEAFLESLVGWITSSNYKVSLIGLECLSLVVVRLQDGFKPYVSLIFNAIVDRLGDSRGQVRDQCQNLLQKLMDPGSSPQFILEKMIPAFQHKNFRVRDESLVCLQKALDGFGSSSLTISKFVPHACKLLADPNGQVRDTAIDTLVDIYRHVGEKVRADLSRRNIPAAKLSVLFTKFNELIENGDLLDTAVLDVPTIEYENTASSATNSYNPSPMQGRSRVATPKTRSGLQTPTSSRYASTENIPGAAPASRKPPIGQTKNKNSNADAGAVNEDYFLNSFNEFVPVQFCSTRELQDLITNINTVLTSEKSEWEQRVHTLKRLRGVIHAGGYEFDVFLPQLKTLVLAHQSAIKDLRSQVCREACITVSFLAATIGIKFDHFAGMVLPMLFQLLPNSAKVMATSGYTCIMFIIKHVHSFKLIPVILSYATSKANVVRSYTFEFMNIILHTWPTQALEKQAEALEKTVKAGLSDANASARASARRSFWGFANHFKSRADKMMLTLDSSKQKQLIAENDAYGSTNSLADTSDGTQKLKAAAFERSSNARRSFVKPKTNLLSTYRDSEPDVRGRSNGDGKINARSSLRMKSSTTSRASPAGNTTKRIPRASQSQPGSRSNSPPRLSKLSSTAKTPTRKVHTPTVDITKSKALRPPAPPKVKEPVKTTNLKTLTRNTEVETHVWNALTQRKSDTSADFESDAGSMTSESSVRSNFTSLKETEIGLTKCKSSSWSERMEGLEEFMGLLVGEHKLSYKDINRIKECLTQMLDEKHMQVYNKFLNTICEFVTTYHNKLQDWFFTIFTKLLLRVSSDMPPPVYSKLIDALDTIRRTFSYDIQFIALVKFISENGDHINIKVKLAFLNFAREVAELMDPSVFVNSVDNRRAMSRIITWSTDPKNVALRKAANIVIIAIFELNKSEFSALLSNLPKSFQDIASSMLQQYLDSGCMEVPESPRASSKVRSSPRGMEKNMPGKDIYSPVNTNTTKPLMARKNSMEDHYKQDNEYNPIYYQDENEPPSPVSNHMPKQPSRRSESIDLISKLAAALPTQLQSLDEVTITLKNLLQLISEDVTLSHWDKHLKGLVSNLFQLITTYPTETSIKVLSFRIMKYLFDLQFSKLTDLANEIINNFIAFEVTNDDREVSRISEEALFAYAAAVPGEVILPVLVPIIEKFKYPSNLSGLKLLNKILDEIQKEDIIPSLDYLMPALVKSFQHNESSVRKACVFCLVALHKIIGEDLKNYLTGLTGSQIKLLHLYIKRSVSQATTAANFTGR